jgi:hypothetical protein
MTANTNFAPKTNAFTLIYQDKESLEIFTHEFTHHEKDIYGDELDSFLTLPAIEEWKEFNTNAEAVDYEEVESLASHYKAIAVITGHPEVELAMEKGVNYNPNLDVFGRPMLRVVN